MAMASPSEPQPSNVRKAAAALLLGVFAACAVCTAFAQPAAPLAQRQLEGEPAAVAAWLRAHAAQADRKTAAQFADLAARDLQRRYWSGAAKAYLESAIHYPDPTIILAYARVRALDLAGVRARARDPARLAKDAALLLKLYQASQAAHGVLGTLSPDQQTEVDAAVQCLSAADATTRMPLGCAPLATCRTEFDRVAAQR